MKHVLYELELIVHQALMHLWMSAHVLQLLESTGSPSMSMLLVLMRLVGSVPMKF